MNPNITLYEEFIKFLGREKIKSVVDVTPDRKMVITIDGYRYKFYKDVLVPSQQNHLCRVRSLGEKEIGKSTVNG